MRNSQRGQALLIVVLIMVVSLTVGLSVVSRTITNLRTTTEEESSQRAFSAAEAGVEQAIKLGCTPKADGTCEVIPGSFTSDNFSTFSVNIVQVSGMEFLPNAGNLIKKDDGVDIWLTPHNPDGTINYSQRWTGKMSVYWGTASDVCVLNNTNTQAAVEIVLLSGTNASDAKFTRYPVDRCAVRQTNNQFYPNGCDPASDPLCPATSSGEWAIGGKKFANEAIIGITNGILMRITPLYANTNIGVKGEVALPTQGKRIESVGKAGTTERKILYYQGYSELPAELFGNLLFSPR